MVNFYDVCYQYFIYSFIKQVCHHYTLNFLNNISVLKIDSITKDNLFAY